MLKAMRANREKLIYDTEKEITPAEQFTMKSKQYQTVVKEREQKEKETLKEIKSKVLHTEARGVSNRTIDI